METVYKVGNKYFADKADAEKAELALVEYQERKKELADNRKSAADKVSKAFDEFIAARNAYHDELSQFCKKYGPYHTKLTPALMFDTFSDIFSLI